MIRFQQHGSFKNMESFLTKSTKVDIKPKLEKIGKEGVDALSKATPEDSGLTATSWSYEVSSSGGSHTITWFNDNVVDGVPVAILLQYGHGTGTGGYVEGYDYINPALKPIFDKLADEVWKVVITA